MKVMKTKELKVNMGNYEHEQFGAMVVVEDVDLFTDEELEGMSPQEVYEKLRDFAVTRVDEILEPDFKEAAAVSVASDSLLFAEEEAPHRTERSKRRRSN